MSRGAGQRGLAHDGRYDDGSRLPDVKLAERLMTAIYAPLVLTALHQGVVDQVMAQPYAIGIDAYGVTPSQTHNPATTANREHLRETAANRARQLYAAMGSPYIGVRSTPWGGELIMFGSQAGVQRWAHEQASDIGVWYAAAFDFSASLMTPFAEVYR